MISHNIKIINVQEYHHIYRVCSIELLDGLQSPQYDLTMSFIVDQNLTFTSIINKSVLDT